MPKFIAASIATPSICPRQAIRPGRVRCNFDTSAWEVLLNRFLHAALDRSHTTEPGGSKRSISSVREIAALPCWAKAARSIQGRRGWLDRLHVELTEIPAPTFRESARTDYMAQKFRELGFSRVRTDAAGNLLGERPGADPDYVIITAHLDTVLPPGTTVRVKRANSRLYGPGVSDNGAGLAALLGVAAALQETKIATGLSLLFVGTVGEEGEGDLCGMRHLFSHRDIRRRTKSVVVIDGASIERTAVAGLGSRRLLIEITGPGGHSWSNFGRVNPIHVLSDAVAQLIRIPLPANPRTSLNVGVIQGGTAVNAIPHSAWMKLDIRSTDPQEIEKLSWTAEAMVRAALEAENDRGSGSLAARVVTIGNRPAAELPATARILQVIRDVDHHLGIKGRLEASSTDANIPLSLGIEAITTGGGGTGGEAHTPNEWYQPQGRALGLKRILLAALALAGVIAES